jgi:hypothetical protein
MEFLSRKETPISTHKNWIFFTRRLDLSSKKQKGDPQFLAEKLDFLPRKDLYSN